jgi:molybdopterin-guanine dinucleotide biosynthesis adapter protein
MRTPVISFVGRSNTGKTTLLERLIRILTERGIRVATVKHHHRDFEADREGKDTYRHKKAGARLSMIVSPAKLALVQDLAEEPTLQEILDRYVTDVDLVIIEGYKKERIPKIEVYNHGSGSPPVTLGDDNLLAIVSDVPLAAAPLPVFLRDDIEMIAAFVIEKLGLSPL